jgi:hypothetical protein
MGRSSRAVMILVGWEIECDDGASQTLLWIGLNWKYHPYKFRTKGLIGKLDCFK